MRFGYRVSVAIVGLALLACDRGSTAKEDRAMGKSADPPAPAAEKPAGAVETPAGAAEQPASAAKEPGGAAPSPASAPEKQGAAGVREMAVPSSSGGHDVKVRARLPASWSQRPRSIVLENEAREAIAGVQFDILCEAPCTDEDIARFAAVVDSSIESWVRPNVTTGDAKMDAVRLDLTLVEKGELPDGRFLVARVARPPGLEGPYRDELVAVCVRGRRGEAAIAAQGWAPLARESELGPIVVEACKTFEIRR